MDINDQLAPIVKSIVDNLTVSIEQQVRDAVTGEIINKLASVEFEKIIASVIDAQIAARTQKYSFEATTQASLERQVTKAVDNLEKTFLPEANKQIAAEINKQLASVDVKRVTENLVENKLASLIAAKTFPDNSIPHTTVNFKGFTLTGDQIKGGIIERFGSTGIEDRSTFVQLTLMDHASVFEGPVFAPSASFTGDVTIDGNLTLRGTLAEDAPVVDQLVTLSSNRVRDSLNADLFRSYSSIIEDNIRQNGLDLDRLTQGGREVIKGNQLGYHITDTNIQRVGIIKDLQTSGESLLINTLYVTDGRVGVNTMDPSAVVSVWDQEVEINLGKRSQDVGYIGTPRYQKLVLSSNNKDNLTLDAEGGVSVNSLTVGKISITSSREVPNYPGTIGQIILNEMPASGGVIGWVCLGDTLWAKFGKID